MRDAAERGEPAAERGGQTAGARGEPEQVLFTAGPASVGARVRMAGSEADHARRSLRLRSGDPVALADGAGARYHGRIVEIGKHDFHVMIERVETLPVWPTRTIWLGAGVLRSTRMDDVVEKASELGVTRFAPLLLKRCVARPHEDGAKQDRWQRIAVESLKQSRRARLLEVAAPCDLADFLAELPPAHTLWAADPAGEDPAEAARHTAAGLLVLVVGPEGGLAPEESAMLARAGARFVRLGGHRLRAETASQALLSAALTALGEFGPAPNQV